MEKRGEDRGGNNARGQIKLSFGMIFSIILIVIFIGFAFYAINFFLGIKNTAEVSKFVNDFQSDVDNVWRSTETLQDKEYFLPSKIEYVCFVDFSSSEKGPNSGFYDELKRGYYGSENLVFYPFGSSDPTSTEIEHIDISKITQSKNPFCVENIDGMIRLKLEKNFDDALVTIK